MRFSLSEATKIEIPKSETAASERPWPFAVTRSKRDRQSVLEMVPIYDSEFNEFNKTTALKPLLEREREREKKKVILDV